ncbi:uncharacterized protein RHOBADRAFT_52977 [Rhodotorula graminis WP1]|uniref:Transcription factor TFIIB cyclin-like domain-containing protein n=1 Tax=Rhodotorula graminis (strain WP1) TaxID=578459 RepID=A0A194S602_RHOGW|nr:uncharacterized protein RHOBADRAFT_52977 [Rhodotorula graminis WP1]KPV75969.1 hypothetical protein RHOBADRAFT_52977 [Rhodotorula graminis WP1]
MSDLDCPACGAHGALEYVAEIGTLACTRCGTVSTSSASHSFELLQRVDAEDAFQNGRTYVGSGGGTFGGAMGTQRVGQRVGTWTRVAEGGTAIYQAQRKTETEQYMRRLLTRYDLASSLRDRVRYLFERARERLGFRWGRKAELFCAACVYVAAREAGKTLWLLELASLIEIEDPIILSRAVKVVKFELKVKYDDHDPALFLERVLVHLQSAFALTSSSASSSNSMPLPVLHRSVGSRKATFSAANAAWVRSVQLPAVRELATGLLALTSDLSLTAGRHGEGVAAAVVIAAIEGVARQPAPIVQEFADEFAWMLGTSDYSVLERYRDINRLLQDFAAKLPWADALGLAVPADPLYGVKRKRSKTARSRKSVKLDVVAHTADIVALRKTLMAAEPVAPLFLPGEEDAKRVDPPDLEYDEYDDDLSYMHDPLFDSAAADRYYGAIGYDEPGAEDPARLSSPGVSAARQTSSPPPVKPFVAAFSPVAAPDTNRRAAKASRPALYSRERDVKPLPSALMLAVAGSTRAGRSLSQTPRTSPDPNALAVHAAAANDAQVRQLLLAGLDLAQVVRGASPSASSSGTAAGPSSRLERLLWTKPVADITDDELFAEGELEAYVRPRDEVQRHLQLPATQAMLVADEAIVLKREERGEDGSASQPPKKPPRPKYAFSAPRDAQGNFLEAAPLPGADAAQGGTRRGVKRGASDGDDDGFEPRKRRTKIMNRAALEAYLARGTGSDNDDDDDAAAGTAEEREVDDEGGGGSSGWQVEMALQAAQDEGEDIVRDADADDDVPEGGGDDDWRKEYGGYRAVEDDDDDGPGEAY